MRKFKDVNELVNTLKPDYPVYCIRPDAIKTSTEFFKKNFPGKILYAVKTNPNEAVLKQIIYNGINHFDVASINEIKLIKKLKPDAKLFFMHTVKSRESISEAYFKLGIRDFALDTKDELLKILESTKQAKDLNLYVRIAISNEHAEIDLSRKFGALPSEALGLIRLCKAHSKKIGISLTEHILTTNDDWGRYKEMFKGKKKDDLADSFLQGLYFIKRILKKEIGD